ncbi:hypothetical protein F5884DRAFT_685941, partial [Xylogone sp. PMI_703]
KEYNMVLVIIYKMTKYFIYILITKKLTVDSLVFLLLVHFIVNYRIPRKIIFDRGSLFINKF